MLAELIATPAPGGLQLDSIVSGGAGATLVGALIFVGKLILDRTIPSRSDARASVSLVLDGLNNMVKVLQDEKLSDAKRLDDRQKRIDALEGASDKDYDRIKDLRAEVIDLRGRLAVKTRHINILVSELQKFGAVVAGIEMDLTDLEITHTREEVKDIRTAAGL